MKISQSLRSMIGVIKIDLKNTGIIIFLLLISTVSEVAGVSLTLPLIYMIIGGEAANYTIPVFGLEFDIKDQFNVFNLLAVIFAAFIVKAIIISIVARIISKTISNYANERRLSYIKNIVNANFEFFEKVKLGDHLTILGNDNLRASNSYINCFRLIAGIIQLVLYFLVALSFSVQITLLTIASGLAIVFFLNKVVDLSRTAGKETTVSLHNLIDSSTQLFRGLKDAKSMNVELFASTNSLIASENLRKAHFKSIFSGYIIRVLQEPIMIASLFGFVIIIQFVGTINLAESLLLIGIFYRMNQAVSLCMYEYQRFVQDESAYNKINQEIANSEIAVEKVSNGHGFGKLPATPQLISVKNLCKSFGDNQVLQNINISIKPNSIMLFHGESGSGKTTVLNILANLLKPDSGDILVGGTHINNISIKEWRDQVGYLGQFPFLINDTLRVNISMGRSVSDDQVKKAIKFAKLDSFFNQINHDLNFIIEENGNNLSGGQIQRISLARAIVNDPKYLFLDEPTSALDHRNEVLIYEALEQLKKSMTIIIVSHNKNIHSIADNSILFNTKGND